MRITVKFGKDEGVTAEFEFATWLEYNAFRAGLDAGVGWLEARVVETDERMGNTGLRDLEYVVSAHV